MRRLVYDDERVGRWMQARGGGEYRPGGRGIGLERDGELVAGAMYDWHNGASVYVHIVSEKHALGRDFLHAAFYYPFVTLGCRVLIGLVAEDNLAAQRLDEHLGFTLEHRIEDGHPSGALRIYTMRPEQCRWVQGGIREQAESASAA